MLIDTHCHINFPDKFPDPGATIADAVANGVRKMFAVGCDMETSRAALSLAEQFDEVHAIVGWHPTYTRQYSPDSLPELEVMLGHPKAVALGEIGLDYHWDFSTPEEQRIALFDQLDLAERLNVPVVFHAREAYPDLLDILEARPPHPYLLHCFAGSEADAVRATALDCYFGVDGPISYKKAEDLREIVRTLPRDRIVIETDSPYMPPEPLRGKPNRPANVRLVNEALAKALAIPAEACAAMTTANAKRFFRLA